MSVDMAVEEQPYMMRHCIVAAAKAFHEMGAMSLGFTRNDEPSSYEDQAAQQGSQKEPRLCETSSSFPGAPHSPQGRSCPMYLWPQSWHYIHNVYIYIHWLCVSIHMHMYI